MNSIEKNIKESDDYWFPYQKEWLNDKSVVKIWEKSRRIGATFVQSYEDFMDITQGVYKNVWFSSTDEDAGKEYLDYVEKWVKLYQAKAKLLGSVVIDKDSDVKATVIEFSNNGRINVLSSNPKNFRGKGGKVILDEFALHEDQAELWAAAAPCIIHGGAIRVMSTHWDKKCMFWNLIHHMPQVEASKHRTSIYDAVRQGLHKRLLDLGKTYKEEKQYLDWLRYTIALTDDKWEREFLLNPVQNTEALVVRNWDDLSSDGNVRNLKYIPYIPKAYSPLGRDEEIDLIITCDFNAAPNCWEVLQITDKIKDGKYVLDEREDRVKDKYYFIDEFCCDMYTEDLIKVVMDKYCGHPSRIVIMGDSHGNDKNAASRKTNFKLIENEMLRRGFLPESNGRKRGKRYIIKVPKSNSSRLERFASWNKCVYNTETKERRIIVDRANCPRLNYNCQELKLIPNTSDYYEPSLTMIQRYPEMRFLGHPFDAGSYSVDYFEHIYKDKQPKKRKEKSTIDTWKGR